jgi:hypothetical protein
MAMAVQKLFPDAQVTIGPWIEKGFFYDFDMKEPFTEKDLKKIKKEMVSRRRTFMLGLHSFIRLHHHHHHHNRAGCYGSWSLKLYVSQLLNSVEDMWRCLKEVCV